MFRTICETMQFPPWAEHDERYKRLCAFDRVIDNTLYDHIAYPFHVETENRQYIPMLKRRPSVVNNLARQVAIKTARKMFAGRQRPQLVHNNAALVEAADVLLREGYFETRMLDCAFRGSVGSVAMTFRILPDNNKKPRVIFDVWKAKWCSPTFDQLGELSNLQVRYTCWGHEFILTGVTKDYEGEDIESGIRYWYICDYTMDGVVSYKPIPESDFDPNDSSTFNTKVPDKNRSSVHNLGFVTGHWFINLSGGHHFPDGTATFAPGIDTSIFLDYTMSQLGRGLWYNASPQIVFQGAPINMNENGGIERGPANVIMFEAAQRSPAGDMLGGGAATLLESHGKIFAEGREMIEQLRKFCLEQMQASRKDPDTLKTAMPTSAMLVLDEDFHDLIQEQRLNYGEQGMLPLVRKLVHAAKAIGHPAVSKIDDSMAEELALQWPQLYNYTADEQLKMTQAIQMAIGTPDTVTKGGDGQPDQTLPGTPELLSPEDAKELISRAYNVPKRESSGLTQQQVPSTGLDG